jgi:GAF domain-containing protein
LIPSERLAEVFVELADTLVDEFDLVEFLQMVTARTSELTAATEAGLLLADPHGNLQFMAASNEQVHLLELFQIQADEGPCRDCFRQAHPVSVADLQQAGQRWPAFAPQAVTAGFRSVHAFPLRLRHQVIGALGIFSRTPGDMGQVDTRIVQALADIATIGLLQEKAIHAGEVLSGQLKAALDRRMVIEQAKGAIAQTYGISVDAAFDLLRSYCRRHQVRLADVAHLIVAESENAPDLQNR